MIHFIKTEHKTEYERTGTNQYGDRYKIKCHKDVRILSLSVKYNSSNDEMWQLMAICSSLGVAPTWSTINDEQRMSIEVVAKKSVM